MSGPSGSGKSTVATRVLNSLDRLRFSVSHTTRSPRPGERDGHDYYFVDKATFEAMISATGFAEWARVHDRFYGTSLAEIERLRSAGYDILLDVDVQGAAQLRQHFDDAVYVFFLPPSLEALEQRLRGRGTESDEQLALRLATARTDLEHGDLFDYVVVNVQVDDAVADLSGIVRAERCRRTRRGALVDTLRSKGDSGS